MATTYMPCLSESTNSPAIGDFQASFHMATTMGCQSSPSVAEASGGSLGTRAVGLAFSRAAVDVRLLRWRIEGCFGAGPMPAMSVSLLILMRIDLKSQVARRIDDQADEDEHHG